MIALDPSHGGPVVGIVGLSSRGAQGRRRILTFILTSKVRGVGEGFLHGCRLTVGFVFSILDFLPILLFVLSQEGDQLCLRVVCADAFLSLRHGLGGRGRLAVASELFSTEGLGLVGKHQALRALIKNLGPFHSHLVYVCSSLLLSLHIVVLRRKSLGLDDFRAVEGLGTDCLCRDLRYSLSIGGLTVEKRL